MTSLEPLTLDFAREHCFLRLIVVYKHPSDFPGEFVAREHFLMRNGVTLIAAEPLARSPLIGPLHDILLNLPGDLYRINMDRSDDPVIEEVWV